MQTCEVQFYLKSGPSVGTPQKVQIQAQNAQFAADLIKQQYGGEENVQILSYHTLATDLGINTNSHTDSEEESILTTSKMDIPTSNIGKLFGIILIFGLLWFYFQKPWILILGAIWIFLLAADVLKQSGYLPDEYDVSESIPAYTASLIILGTPFFYFENIWVKVFSLVICLYLLYKFFRRHKTSAILIFSGLAISSYAMKHFL